MTMRIRNLLLGATAVAALAGAAVLLAHEGSDIFGDTTDIARAAPAMPAMPVPVAKVIKKAVPIYLDYAARTEAIQNVTLQAKVSGYLLQQVAPEGADVKAGELLYKIDPRDYQAALDQARAQADRDAAALTYASANLSRGTQLARTGFLAKDSFDQRESTKSQAEAALAMDKALVHTAEINLGYTEIRAPFAGRIGRNQAPLGTLVNPANTVLNTLVQLDPIYVTFNPSETDLAAIEKAEKQGKVKVDILLPGETVAHHFGTLSFLNNVVDRATGTIAARASVDNADFSLLPGQYVKARVHLGEDANALLVPQTALGSSQFGKYIYIVSHNGTAEQRLVSLGPTDGELVTVTKGVAEGDEVINGNLQKIGPGSPVRALPAVAK
jgi:multidrug efflux system membrane fusion protein